ncbi:stage III sporulation protein AF [Cohnella fermenti]|uniref:Stage III sporulation protein AF n=1 Tax=Cohnella fermenti TaxID=2565925 RepID=A0A4S4BNN4_9BACL|nr:stage III sporulation protein AF [Cohnella fermenti]THF75909.1 stage III sporulation protein AF [Cohnella fermenti]
MMAALAEWLKQVIVVVLLASIVDLLLPNQTMQRYVRLVAGLFILLALIGPLLSWIKADFGTKLAAGIESVRLTPEDAKGQLAQIEEDAARLRMSRDEQVASLAAAQLAAEIKVTVEQEGGASVRNVQVKTGKEADGTIQVQAVEIVLADPEDASGASGASGADSASGSGNGESDPIREVEPVIIDLGSQDEPGAEGSREPAAAAETGVLEQRIVSLVSSRYGMGAGMISVRTEGAAGESGNPGTNKS